MRRAQAALKFSPKMSCVQEMLRSEDVEGCYIMTVSSSFVPPPSFKSLPPPLLEQWHSDYPF